jgi:hypothetical protein
MNCRTLRGQLLACPRPDRPGSAARGHLAHCAACQAWHGRLLALEQDLPRLYVPPALDAKAALLHAIRRGDDHVEGVVRLNRRVSTTPKERGLRKLAMSVALAAGLAVFAVGWAFWPHSTPIVVPTDPLAGRIADRDQRLASAGSPRERVEVIANLSEEVRHEALLLNDRDQLNHLIRFYSRLVRDDLPSLVHKVPREERLVLINQLTERLIRAESETDRLSVEPGRPTAELRTLAALAREGQGLLHDLL